MQATELAPSIRKIGNPLSITWNEQQYQQTLVFLASTSGGNNSQAAKSDGNDCEILVSSYLLVDIYGWRRTSTHVIPNSFLFQPHTLRQRVRKTRKCDIKKCETSSCDGWQCQRWDERGWMQDEGTRPAAIGLPTRLSRKSACRATDPALAIYLAQPNLSNNGYSVGLSRSLQSYLDHLLSILDKRRIPARCI